MLVAAALVVVEAVALIAFAVLDLADVHGSRLVLGVGTSMFFLAYAGGQLVAAVALLKLLGWARGPIVFTQLVQLGLAWGLRGAGPPWLAGVLAVIAVIVLSCLLRRSSTEVLYGSENDPEQR